MIKNTRWLKRLILCISFCIVSLILWNTYIFFQKFKIEERAKMETYATAIEELANRDINASVALPLKVIEETRNIPLILVHEDGRIKEWFHLDTEKSKDSTYVRAQLAKMKQENQPITIEYLGVTEKIYYRNSALLNQLTYYPLALILILVLFLTVLYMLFSSNKVAEQNKLWTGMAKETAHQIGTPLSSLLGWIAILKEEKVDPTYISEMEKDVDRLNIIANRFSKIGSAPTLQKQSIVQVSKRTFEYLESRSSKKIDFQFYAPQEEVFVKINTELFGWVLENLVKNAIDAMQGKGTVSLRIEEGNTKVKLLITDTGKGIEKAYFKQVFKPGFTSKKRGWGLGLSLSKRIVEKYHNGKIRILKSELHKGTSFLILLNKA